MRFSLLSRSCFVQVALESNEHTPDTLRLAVDEVAQVIAGHCGVVIELAVRRLWCSPGFPAMRLVKDEAAALAFEFGLGSFVLFERVEVFQEQQPR